MADSADRFQWPNEVEIPDGCEGWAEMYPDNALFDLAGREAYERESFWFRDKVHAPEALPPWVLTLQEGWRLALPEKQARVFAVPPSMGVRLRILNGYMYLSAVHCGDPELKKERKGVFEERSDYYYEHFERLYEEEWFPRQRELGREMERIEVPEELPRYTPDETFGEMGASVSYDIVEGYNRLVELILESYQLHFEFNNLAYLAYMTFSDFCKEAFPQITDDVVGKMVAAVDTDLFRPEAKLNELARAAAERPEVAEVLKRDVPADDKLAELEATEGGREWLAAFEEARDPWFYMSSGSGWYPDEVRWKDDLAVPLDFIRTKVESLEKGNEIGRDVDALQAEKEELVAEYRGYLDAEEDRRAFEKLHETCQMIYQYPENHHFWLEHWKHTIIFDKMREFGRLLVNHGFLADPDDVFMFDRFEVSEMLADLTHAWVLGPEAMPREATAEVWTERAERRNEIFANIRDWEEPPALGRAPDEVQDAITVMMFGITTAKVNAWLGVGEDDREAFIEGFPASKGVAEGVARVAGGVDEIDRVEEGEILVCKATNPSWAPAFPKIAGAVTDIGGIASHAAIVCREYGLPAVTGTGKATQVIETGDRVRIDGEVGEVELLGRGDE